MKSHTDIPEKVAIAREEKDGGIEVSPTVLECVTILEDQSDVAHKFPEITTVRSIALVALVMTSALMQVASGIGGSITIADIGQELKIPSGQLQWVASSGSLATACTLLLSGKICDMYGHKPVFSIGSAIGGAMFLGMGLARNKYQLFIFRALAGVAFSGVTPAAIGLIGTTFAEGPIKSRAFAGLGAGAPVGTAVGLVLAGVTTQYTKAGWRTFFYICSGMSFLLSIGNVFVAPGSIIPRTKHKHALRHLDWVGVVLSGGGIFCVLFPLGEGGTAASGWKTPYISATLVSGFVLLGLFLTWERYLEKKGTRPPIMKLSIWRRDMFGALMGAVLFLGGAFGAIIVWMSLYWRSYEERPVIEATLRFLPLCIVGIAANVVGSFCVAHISGHILLLIASFATGLAGLLFATTPAGLTYWAMQFPACCILVWGADFMFLTCMLFISRTSSQDEQGQGGSIFSAVTQIGGVLVLSISTIVSDRIAEMGSAKLGIDIVASKTTSSSIPKTALLQGYRAAFWTCFGLSALAGLLVGVFVRKMGNVGKKDAVSHPDPEASVV